MSSTTALSERAAAALAESYISARHQIAELEKEVERIEANLRDYVQDTGSKDVGPLMAFTRSTPPKLVLDPTVKGKVDTALQALMADSAAEPYIRHSVSAADLAKDIDQRNVQALLRRYKLSVVSEERIYFKAKP